MRQKKAIFFIMSFILALALPSIVNAQTTTKKYLFVVHGFSSTSSDPIIQEVANNYRIRGYDEVFTPEYYPSAKNTGSIDWDDEYSRSIADYAKYLYNEMKNMLKDLDEGDVDIVAHSMGGLVVRYMMTHYMYIDANKNARFGYIEVYFRFGFPYFKKVYKHRIDDIVLIGTPNKGTLLANYVNSLVYGFVPKQCKEMITYSDFLLNLNAISDPSNAKWYVVVGYSHPETISATFWGIEVSVKNRDVFGIKLNDGVVQYSSAIYLTYADGFKTYSIYDHTGILRFTVDDCYNSWLKY